MDGMKTTVVLTVDTEPSIAGAFADPVRNTPLLHEPVGGVVGGKSEALGFLIRTLARFGLKATFFVETVHTHYFPETTMRRYVEDLVTASQDVQLHLHPCWLSFRDGAPDPSNLVTDNCSELAEDDLAALIATGADCIESWTGARPTAMRTGNYATAMSVFRAMAKAGLRDASNICLAAYRPRDPELAVTGGQHLFAGVRELPVTCFADVGPVGRGRLRPLQVTALGAVEHIRMLERIHAASGRLAVIVTHPFEFVKSNGIRYAEIRPNGLVQKRFERLCGFLAGNADRFQVLTLGAAAAAAPGPFAARPLRGSAVHAVWRAAENVVNDRML
jgi:peptidoglycan/xylan/chitin deacetylase (PgdA/CDA1 family)